MDDPADRPSRPRRWMAVALFASLALNLAVIGLGLGLLVGGAPHGPRGEVGLWRYGSALPEPFRGELGRDLRRGRGDWGDMRQRLRGQRTALAAALTAEPFDMAAVAGVLNAERVLLDGLADRGNGLLLAQIEQMGPEERRAYAAALTEPRRGSRGSR